MTRLKRRILKLAAAGLVAGASLFFYGCASADPHNISSRPWNAPRGWEHGVPSTLMEGR